MSVYVVERPARDSWMRGLGEWLVAVGDWPPRLVPRTFDLPSLELRDCNEHDGEWPAFITLAHETVEHESRAVPLFEGDVERREWEAQRGRRRYVLRRR